MPLNRDELLARIRAAFEFMRGPAEDDILAHEMRTFIDPIELRVAIAGKHWSDLEIATLSFHREMISALGPTGFRAYVAAFLVAALAGDRRSPDIYQWTLFALYPHDETEHESTRARLSLLDDAQRDAIGEWLQYFADYDREAARLLDGKGLCR